MQYCSLQRGLRKLVSPSSQVCAGVMDPPPQRQPPAFSLNCGLGSSGLSCHRDLGFCGFLPGRECRLSAPVGCGGPACLPVDRNSRFSSEERPGSGRLRGNHTHNFQTGALFAMKDTSWDHALEVAADGNGLVGHVGGILLRKLADQGGLTAELDAALTQRGRPRSSAGAWPGIGRDCDRDGRDRDGRRRSAGPARARARRGAGRFHGPPHPEPGR